MLDDLPFAEIWAVDFEFGAEPGENPEPVCLVAWELRSGRKVKVWRDEFGVAPPYPTGPDALFVAYYASAEIVLPLGACLAGARARAWTCSPSSATARTAFPRAAAPACLARLPFTVWTVSARSKKTKCAPWSCAAGRGRTLNGRRSSITAKATWRRWRGCCRRCCPRSICPARSCGAAT